MSNATTRIRPWGARSRVAALAAVAVGATGLAGCAGGTESSAESTGDAPADGPVSIEIWGWDELGEQVVDAFNAAQDGVEATYVLQADNVAMATNFRNAFESGTDVPCLAQGFAPLTTMVVNGWAQDITDVVEPSLGNYNEGAHNAAQVNGRFFGLPSGSDGQYLIVNTATLDEYGVEIPATWDEFVEAGRELKEHDVHVTNFAGEDPTALMNLAQQAGAEWFAIDGEEWVVNFEDAPTLQAADIVQQLIDEDLVSNETYQDRPALYSYFDSGNMAMTPTQWWSLTGLQTNFSDSLGDWKATTLPQFDLANPVSPGRTTPSFVPVGCEHPEAVVAYSDWRTTPEGIEAGRNPETDAVGLPTQIPDPAPYAADIIPPGFFTDDAEAAEVIVDAQSKVIGKFELGPNYDAWFPEMQDQWGKAVAGEQTIAEALAAVQQYVEDDLDRKGIAFRDAS
ncbi:ABC transporter substrate-binding protein [Isoptericola croceus]|uniref:ABC transporter substrate-binding protein n=1 Tax=Isoptericola croceus TaxID=3031406 RepID=UPI0023F9EF5F|nr:extracellular solute-binding protein [Isoptericola croceus]